MPENKNALLFAFAFVLHCMNHQGLQPSGYTANLLLLLLLLYLVQESYRIFTHITQNSHGRVQSLPTESQETCVGLSDIKHLGVVPIKQIDGLDLRTGEEGKGCAI